MSKWGCSVTKFNQAITSLASVLENASIPYTFINDAAWVIQGMQKNVTQMTILIQWDIMDACHSLFQSYSPTVIKKSTTIASFTFTYEEYNVEIKCFFNTTIKTDPYRIRVQEVWCRSLYSYLYDKELNKDEIIHFLQNKQQELTQHNEQAWNQSNYIALVNRYGEPSKIAEKIIQNPEWRLHPFLKYFSCLKGKKVLHLLGSNGVKATALALLGAQVTVVDFSKENAAYAKEIASAADVSIKYIVSDVFSIPKEDQKDQYDYVLMELGVLHYFITLDPLIELIQSALLPQGKLILHEFHPISTKLITSAGKKHKVDGNYFNPELTYQSVAFSKHMPDDVEQELLQTVHRKWTIGEIVTSVATSGMRITVLEEEPNHKLHDIGLPKTYTLVAEK